MWSPSGRDRACGWSRDLGTGSRSIEPVAVTSRQARGSPYAQPVTSQRPRRKRAASPSAARGSGGRSAAQTPRSPSRPRARREHGAQARNAITMEPARNGPSPAPIRIPSSANTAPFSGCISAKSGQRSAVSSSTASSPVKIRADAESSEHHQRRTRRRRPRRARSSAPPLRKPARASRARARR